MSARIIALPKRPKKRGRKPTKPPSCPVFNLDAYRPQISAEVLYWRAHALDEDPACYEQAERLYREAIRIKPDYALAMTNLGNIRFRRHDPGEAREWYRRALELDPSQPEAHYNLGYLWLEEGFANKAVDYLREAVKLDPRFSDAHFNLAMALEQLECFDMARVHWRRYLALEPVGTWSDIARRHV